MRNKKGFTLIEILVVIAVIMILIALLLPVILRARESALMYYCMNNLHVLGKCHHAYAADYNDGIVPHISLNKELREKTGFKDTWWRYTLRPYGMDILEGKTYGSTSDAWVQCPVFKSTWSGYAHSTWVGFKYWTFDYRDYPVKFAQIPNPGSIVLMGEDSTAEINQIELTTGFGKDWGQVEYNFASTPHFGRLSLLKNYSDQRWVDGMANVLFCDGHCEVVSSDNNWLVYPDNMKLER
jgi:prepilin-type N-terminal cleavage/methylation domain-containing protein/prepilin-type processing-associated H-X9-DG protein